MTVPLLILRPEADARATAARAVSLGLSPVIRSLFAVVPCAWSPPTGPFDAVMMTSAHAARLGGSGLAAFRSLPLYAVGPATAEAAHAAGFDCVITGDSGVTALLARIAADGHGRVLHLAGRETTEHPDPPFECVERITYALDPLPAPPLPGRAVALVHSARSGRRLADLVTDRAAIDVVAIGPRAAATVGTGWRSVATATKPDDAAMLALALPLCEMAR